MIRISSWIAAAIVCALATPAAAQGNGFEPVTRDMLVNPPPGDWLMLNRTYDEQRFSPLDQVNRGNVSGLKMAWTRGLTAGTQETTPIVAQGRHVRDQPERRRAGAQRHQRRPDLGLLARDPQGDGRRHRRADARAHQRPRHLRGPGVLRRARRRPGGARCQDRQDALGDQGSRLQGSDPIDVGADRRRRQGDHRPHLRDARRLLHRGARRQDRQGALEILPHARAGRAGRRFMGQRAARATDREQLGAAGLLRSGAQGALLGDRQSQAVDPLEAPRQHRRGSALGAVRALQQLDRRARRRDRQARLVLPASAGRRLGPRSYPRADAGPHRHQSRPGGGEVDQSQHPARAGARRRGRGRGGGRHLAARPRHRAIHLGDAVPARRARVPYFQHRRRDRPHPHELGQGQEEGRRPRPGLLPQHPQLLVDRLPSGQERPLHPAPRRLSRHDRELRQPGGLRAAAARSCARAPIPRNSRRSPR